jgi:protein O-GlcNAc transferase
VLSRIGAAAFPALPVPRPRAPGERLRVGFVSSYFRAHTVGRLFRGWMRDLDRHRFEVWGFANGGRIDAETELAAAACDQFSRLSASLTEAVAALVDARLDVLIYPEIGMDPSTMRLAGLRLAPVQAVAWGHPVTTGLPTIDLFLSSAAMAVAPDRRWTTETRVDLPGLSVHVDPPAVSSEPLPLPSPLQGGGPRLLCVQTLAKYRPWTDALHVAIATGAPDARLVFVEDNREAVTAAFRARLGAAFERAGRSLDDHVCFLPRLGRQDWCRLLAAGDVFLDSPGWSGGYTTMEALSHGLPCLAFPGDTMRGRHTLGMVRELGIAELEARDADDYVQRAVGLARDGDLRARLRERVQQGVASMLADRRGVRALEGVLLEQVSAVRRLGGSV